MAAGPQPPTTLGMSWRATVSLPGSSRSGEKTTWTPGSSSARADLQAVRVAGFEQRNNDFLGGAGIGGALQHDQLALVNIGSDGLDGSGHVAQVGLVVLVERGGHADDDRVHLGDFGVVRGGAEA